MSSFIQKLKSMDAVNTHDSETCTTSWSYETDLWQFKDMGFKDNHKTFEWAIPREK